MLRDERSSLSSPAAESASSSTGRFRLRGFDASFRVFPSWTPMIVRTSLSRRMVIVPCSHWPAKFSRTASNRGRSVRRSDVDPVAVLVEMRWRRRSLELVGTERE